MPESIKYFQLPKKFWHIAKTSNRLERLFEELKRRIRVFRRFPNPKSCKRWLYALLRELNKADLGYPLYESQQSSWHYVYAKWLDRTAYIDYNEMFKR